MSIELGALLNIPFGEDDRVDEVDPVISFLYEFHPGWRVIAGTIDRNHPLLDGMFNNDILQFNDPIEQGFQFQVKRDFLVQDLWIDWEEIETSTRQEKFSIGNFTQFKIAGFMADVQVYWVHRGGQRNSGGGVDNNLTYAIGGGYAFSPADISSGWSFFQELGADFHYMKVKNEPLGMPETKEDGTVGKIFARLLDIDFYYKFWSGGGMDFQTAKGDPLYRADDFQEFGVEKSIFLTDQIILTAGFKGQWVLDKFVHEDLISLKWRTNFPLFPEYFKKFTELTNAKDAPTAKETKKKRRKKRRRR